MATKKTKTLAEVTAVTTINTNQYIPLADTNGGVTRITLADFKTALLAGMDLGGMFDNIRIMYHAKNGGVPTLSRVESWTALQSAGDVADGVAILGTGKTLVVAPTQSMTMNFASTAMSGDGTSTGDRATAQADMDGRANTTAQLTHTEFSGTGYAAGFCNAYSRTNANGAGLTAGKWWLPSLGELLIVLANLKKVNYALSLITNATEIKENQRLWSSTENGVNAWYLVTSAYTSHASKTGLLSYVLPVSDFIL